MKNVNNSRRNPSSAPGAVNPEPAQKRHGTATRPMFLNPLQAHCILNVHFFGKIKSERFYFLFTVLLICKRYY